MVEADAVVHPTNATFYLGGEVGMYQTSCFLVTVQWNNDVTKCQGSVPWENLFAITVLHVNLIGFLWCTI